MVDNDAPIGIFDSGVGGLTVARSVIDQLYYENIFYIGDTAYGPYGQLSLPEIRTHALAVADKLVNSGVKALVIACNTASTACFAEAKTRYDIPVVEVIRPTAKRALVATETGKIGVMGTTATVNSSIYQNILQEKSGVEVTAVACPKLVEFVEAGITSGAEIEAVLQIYLQPLLDNKVDTIVLGCTHYPFLSGVIQMLCGPNITLVSSAEETTKEFVQVLTKENRLRTASSTNEVSRIFEATGSDVLFDKMAKRFLGPRI